MDLNDEKNIEIYPNKNVVSVSPSQKKKKKVIKKKKKKQENVNEFKLDSPTEPAQEAIPIKVNTYKKPKNSKDNVNVNGNEIANNIKDNVINLNEGKQGEINKIKNSTKPFGNIKFNNRVVKNHGRNEISKGQYSMQKDQTDRGLLKSNL